MGRERVAGKGGAVDEEDVEPRAREQHGRRGARDARPDHDDVVHVS
jgi:hypothetical protein